MNTRNTIEKIILKKKDKILPDPETKQFDKFPRLNFEPAASHVFWLSDMFNTLFFGHQALKCMYVPAYWIDELLSRSLVGPWRKEEKGLQKSNLITPRNHPHTLYTNNGRPGVCEFALKNKIEKHQIKTQLNTNHPHVLVPKFWTTASDRKVAKNVKICYDISM